MRSSQIACASCTGPDNHWLFIVVAEDMIDILSGRTKVITHDEAGVGVTSFRLQRLGKKNTLSVSFTSI
jgi:hypothetical protein